MAAWHLLPILPDSAQASHHHHEATLTLSYTPICSVYSFARFSHRPGGLQFSVHDLLEHIPLAVPTRCASKKASPVDSELFQGKTPSVFPFWTCRKYPVCVCKKGPANKKVSRRPWVQIPALNHHHHIPWLSDLGQGTKSVSLSSQLAKWKETITRPHRLVIGLKNITHAKCLKGTQY